MMMSEIERPDFLERHYTVPELAKAWHMSKTQVREWFEQETDVIRWGSGRLTKNRKRTYISLRIPESVARRVWQRRKGR